ncbi:ABC transporter ATP-binding protein [Cellulosilyticum ruminicola]|uniref:ABC transporter ATP-binding protein n=1 Tax=Cellulosilyticum ruminicola TaxID=425254 RepID=UPI0006D28C0D|nr:ABC transporter ATP-binding protein [Cellulosilyticum ruminicola]
MDESKKYGVFKNLRFIIIQMNKCQKWLNIMLVLQVILSAVSVYFVPFLIKVLIEQVQMQQSVNKLIGIVSSFAVIMLSIKCVNGLLESQTWWRIIDCRIKFLRQAMEKTLKMDYQLLENPKALDCYYKAMHAVDGEARGIEGMIRSSVGIATLIVQSIVAIVILSTLNPILMLMMCLIILLQFIPVDWAKQKDKKEVWDRLPPEWRKQHALRVMATDFEYGKDIRLYNMANWIHGKQVEIDNNILQAMKHSRNIWLKSQGCVCGLKFIQDAVLYLCLIYYVIYRNLSIANFTLYIAAVNTFSTSLGSLLNQIATVRNQAVEVDDFRQFMNYEEDKKDALINKDEKYSINDFLSKTQSIQLEFRNVSFKYEGQEQEALHNINLKLGQGERLAIVGLNGAGKSTFIKLLCRLYEPTEGAIYLNGIDVRMFDKEEYFRLFAPVFQNVELYAFPLAVNVSMKVPHETDKEKVKKCLKDAGLNEKVNKLPKGIETQLLKVLYDDGVDLSGGERQKLALARALYKDAPIIMLDEPTAALDPLAEEKLYRDFDHLIGGHIAIYISHRLSSTRFCNHVALFEEGQVQEYGTHEELIAINGKYAQLYNVQAQYYKEEIEGREVV